MIDTFLESTFLVVIAEMGDKTQLLGMAFATIFSWQSVLAGVFVATVANHWLAVWIGQMLAGWISPEMLQLLSAFLFIFFGLWTLWGDTLDKEALCKSGRGPFLTVAIAFFFAEMGDKTQILTMTLATQYDSFLAVWAGSTTGMMISNGLGIVIGVVLGKKIPARAVQWCSAVLFMGFGIYTLWAKAPQEYLNLPWISGFLAFLIIAIIICWKQGKTKAIDPLEDLSCPPEN